MQAMYPLPGYACTERTPCAMMERGECKALKLLTTNSPSPPLFRIPQTCLPDVLRATTEELRTSININGSALNGAQRFSSFSSFHISRLSKLITSDP